MRTLKVLAVLSLVFAISGTASAISLGGYTGPLKIKYENWDFGRLYDAGQSADTEAGVDALTEFGAAQVNLPGSPVASEDSWFVARIISIGPISGGTIWNDGDDGKELIGLGYGLRDTAAYAGPTGLTYIFSDGLTLDIYEQDSGVFDNPATTGAFQDHDGHTLGSSGRTGVSTYTGIGDDASSQLLVRLETIADADAQIDQFIPSIPLITPKERYEMEYELDGPVGQTYGYLDATGGRWGDGILGNGELVDGPWLDPVTNATMDDAEVLLAARSWVNVPDYGQATDDWYFESDDPINTTMAVPEPLTMVALFGSIAGLGGYIRKRRSA